MVCRRLFVYLSYFLLFIAFNNGEIKASRHGKVLYSEYYPKTQTTSLVAEGRVLVETGKVLADTVRVDPLKKFKKYRGGFDITNKHYWSSTAFTGIPGYAIGVLWLLCGILFGVYLLATRCAKKKDVRSTRDQSGSRNGYLLPIVIGASLTILLIVVSGITIGGSTRFHSRVKTVTNIIIDTTNGASDTMYNVTAAMRGIRDNVELTNGGTKAVNFLNSTADRLDTDAAELSRQAKKNRRLIDKVLKLVHITTIVIVSVNLMAVIALSVCGFLKMRQAFYLLIILCWFMASLCWIYFGLYFFLHKFAGDTCTALKDFEQNPNNNSLSSIIPCDELKSAESVLFETRVGIFNLINQVNQNITTSFKDSPFRVCNPFSAPPEYSYQSNNCPPNSIQIGEVPQVISAFTCSGANGACEDGQFISPNDFRTAEVYTSSIQELLDAFPNMESLVDCQIVKDAFAKIISKHCKPINKFVTMAWVSLVLLSTFMVVLVLLWTAKVLHDLTHNFSDGSVQPHSAAAQESELNENIGTANHQMNDMVELTF